jgi:hypothetical protein
MDNWDKALAFHYPLSIINYPLAFFCLRLLKTAHHACVAGTDINIAPSSGQTITIKSPFASPPMSVRIASMIIAVQKMAAMSGAQGIE